jgi:hypothetical protein
LRRAEMRVKRTKEAESKKIINDARAILESGDDISIEAIKTLSVCCRETIENKRLRKEQPRKEIPLTVIKGGNYKSAAPAEYADISDEFNEFPKEVGK